MSECGSRRVPRAEVNKLPSVADKWKQGWQQLAGKADQDRLMDFKGRNRVTMTINACNFECSSTTYLDCVEKNLFGSNKP